MIIKDNAWRKTEVLKSLNIYIHHNEYVSFTIVAQMLREYLLPYVKTVKLSNDIPVGNDCNQQPDVVIYIHDSIDILSNPEIFSFQGKVCTIAWSDTCLDGLLYDRLDSFQGDIHIVTSESNRNSLSHLGIDGVLPRSYDTRIVTMILNEKIRKEDYCAVIGSRDQTDRKNFHALEKILSSTSLPVKSISPASGPWESISYGTLTEEEKYRFLAKAKFLIHLSKSEGFGMPPLEAMSVGTPVIYSNAPAHNEFCVGFPINIANKKKVCEVEPSGKKYNATYHCIDIDHGMMQIEKALVMESECYESLRNKCIITAKRFSAEVVTEIFINKYLSPALRK